MLYRALRLLLFRLPAETAHRLVLWGMALLARIPGGCALLELWYGKPDPVLRVSAFGRELASPIGLAAGLDKDAEAFEAFAALGFGFVEVGTLTGRAAAGQSAAAPVPPAGGPRADQPHGLQQPRRARRRRPARRARRARAPCSASTSARPRTWRSTRPSTTTCTSASVLAPHADYLVVNVSSPNTPGLRDLQAVEQLRPLLAAVRSASSAAAPGPARAAAGQDRARPGGRGRRRGRRPGARARARRHRSRPTPRSGAPACAAARPRSRAAGLAGCRALRSRRARSRCCAAARPARRAPAARLGRRDRDRRRRLGAPARRRIPRAGLHRADLRGAVASSAGSTVRSHADCARPGCASSPSCGPGRSDPRHLAYEGCIRRPTVLVTPAFRSIGLRRAENKVSPWFLRIFSLTGRHTLP